MMGQVPLGGPGQWDGCVSLGEQRGGHFEWEEHCEVMEATVVSGDVEGKYEVMREVEGMGGRWE